MNDPAACDECLDGGCPFCLDGWPGLAIDCTCHSTTTELSPGDLCRCTSIMVRATITTRVAEHPSLTVDWCSAECGAPDRVIVS